MPNWCHNTLRVEGAEEDVIEFVNRARTSSGDGDQPFFFSNFIPEPDYENEGDWWGWRIENWGTKWEPNFGGPFLAMGAPGSDPSAAKNQIDLQGSDGELSVSYEFDTAWAPPVPVIRAASRQHPDLQLEIVWGEPGGDFGGRARFVGGLCVYEEEGDAEEYLPEEKMWF